MRRSAISDFLVCPQLYHLAWELQLEQPDRRQSEPLVLGQLVHHAFSGWFNVQPNERSGALLVQLGKDTLDLLESDPESLELTPLPEDKLNDYREKFRLMLKAYYETFGKDEKIYGETEQYIEFKHAEGDPDPLYGTCDVEFVGPDGGIWIGEHKTGFPDIEHLVTMSFQPDFYHALLRKNGIKTRGTCFTIIERPTQRNKTPAVQRHWIEVTDWQCEDALNTALGVELFAHSRERFRHRGIHCGWCQFQKFCYISLTAGPQKANAAIESLYAVRYVASIEK